MRREFRSSFDYTLGGVVTGLVVVAAGMSAGTSATSPKTRTRCRRLRRDHSGRMESFSFVSPMRTQLGTTLMLWTDKSRIITYGIASAAA